MEDKRKPGRPKIYDDRITKTFGLSKALYEAIPAPKTQFITDAIREKMEREMKEKVKAKE